MAGPRPQNPRQRQQPQADQNDPGESNDPRRSERSEFDIHSWNAIHQIFERLGKIDAKLDHLDAGQNELKTSVDSHESLIKKVTWTCAAIVGALTIAFAVYDRFFSEYTFMKPPPAAEKSTKS